MSEAATGAAAPAAPAAAAPPANPPAAAGSQSAPWYGDKVDEVTVGFWKNKGIDPADPVSVATKLTEFYRNSEKFVGAPPEQMIRIPSANAPEADVRAYWNRIGVPAEPKDYDLAGVKFSNGTELDQGFIDTFRAAAHSARVPKEQAAGLMQSLVKHMEQNDAAELAERTTLIKAQQEALDKNWGTNKNYFMEVSKRALETLGAAAGLTPEQAKQGWDAISSGGHIGGAYALEMLRTVAQKLGEAPFVPAQPGQAGNNQMMSIEQAKAEINSLKNDAMFRERLLKGGTEEKRRWGDLHKIAYPAARVA